MSVKSVSQFSSGKVFKESKTAERAQRYAYVASTEKFDPKKRMTSDIKLPVGP
jgi:hypothetical protein